MLARLVGEVWRRTSRVVQDMVIERVADRPEERRTLEVITGRRLVDGIGLVEDPIVIVPRIRAPRNRDYIEKGGRKNAVGR